MVEKLLYLVMPVLGKETERLYVPDEVATKEVENYVERVEKQTEQYVPDDPNKSNPQPNQLMQSGQVKTSGGMSGVQKPNIVLPLDQNGVTFGLRAKVSLGVKWLAEWCVMMIKKYPGRVFYSPSRQT